MHHVVDLADVALGIESGTDPIATGVALLIDHLPPAGRAADVTIRQVEHAPARPGRSPDHAVDRLEIWVEDDDLVVGDATGACAHLAGALAVVGGGGERAANGFHALFLFALTHLLAPHQRHVLHAGAVVGPDDGAQVMLGGSGSGKSTLAAAALELGWRVLGDDMVVLRQGRAGLEVHGVPRAVAVPRDVGARLPGTPMETDPRGRLSLPPDCLAAGWFPVGGVLVVGHGDTPAGGTAPAEPQDVVRTAVASYTSAISPGHLRRFLPVAAALGRVPARHLSHGVEAATRLAAARRLLATG